MRGRFLAGVITGVAAATVAGLLVVPSSAAQRAAFSVAHDQSLSGFSGTAARAYQAGIEGYVVGYPLVVMRRTEAVQTCRTGVNQLMNSARLFTPADRDVVTPNNDTIYTLAWLELRPGPQLLTLPQASPDRYFSFAFLDMYTNNIEVAHGGATGPARYLVVGPHWHQRIPSGVTVVRSPTPDVWVIGRTFVQGPSDLDAAKAFQQNYQLTGPAGHNPVPPGTDCTTLPTPQSVSSAGIGFFDELSAGLAADPPTRADRHALRKLYRIGAGPGQTPSQNADPAIVAGLTASIGTAQQYIDQRGPQARVVVNGWGYAPVIGVYGTDYLARAYITEVGLGALPRTEAVYFNASGLTGTNNYVLHFPAGQLPPVNKPGFWSVTMYDATTRFLVDNPINRYAINSADPDLVYNPDGSLDLYLQHAAPAGHESNWLPAPAGGFYIVLRVYLPTPAVTDGSWAPPTLTAQ